jgi:hypothetical protein
MMDDVQYVADLGLIRVAIDGTIAIANPIYQEIIPRELSWNLQMGIYQETAWYVAEEGRLNLHKLFSSFQKFFREHSEHWVERLQYKEAGPQLLLQAFLQRVVNSGGRAECEYGLGRMRTDLLVIWPIPDGVQRSVIELKVKHKSLEKTLSDGLPQTAAYMDQCAAAEGHLVIFDRDEGRTWEKKFSRKNLSAKENFDPRSQLFFSRIPVCRSRIQDDRLIELSAGFAEKSCPDFVSTQIKKGLRNVTL